MLKKFVVSLLLIFLSMSIVIVSESEAQGPSDYDERIPYIIPFWQGGDSFADFFIGYDLHGWGCDTYAGKGIASPCYKPNGIYFADNTIGAQGCAITSLTMMFWHHGITTVPDSDGFLDPGKLDDWLVDNGGYNLRNLVWWVPTGKFSEPIEWLSIIYDTNLGATFVKTRGYHFMVPNYCCDDSCTEQAESCYWIDRASQPQRFDDFLYKDTKNHIPDIMKIWWRKNVKNSWRGHFVVVGGYDKASAEYRDYDPGKHYGWPAPGFNAIYPPDDSGEPNYKFLSLRRFTDRYSYKKTVDSSVLYTRAHSPVEMLMIDPFGRRTGYDPSTGINLADNAMSLYTIEYPIDSIDPNGPTGEPYKELSIVFPPDGNYILQIFGTGDGPYTIELKGMTSDGVVNLDTSFAGTATPGMLQTYRITYSPDGQASLSQSNQTPIAKAGVNQTGEQSYEIALDGSASHDPDGDPMTYTWSFTSKPNNSGATLSDPHAIKPVFTPDLPGTYVLQLVVNDHFIDSASSTVTITATPVKSIISAAPNFSTLLTAGSGIISFDVNNIGRVGVSSGVITFSLTDPTGFVVSSGSQAFSIAAAENATITVPVALPPLKFGAYTLTYAQSDETKTGTPTTVTVSNSSLVVFSFDKIIYRARDTANLTLSLTNTGKFNPDGATLTVSVPDAGYSNSQSLGQGQTPPLQYAIPIPSNVIAGQHDVNATLTLPGGSSVTQTARIVLQDSTLVLDMATPSQLVAGGLVDLTVENQGSIDTTYTTQKLTLTDNRGIVAYQGSVTDTVMAGEKKTLTTFNVPSQMAGTIAFLAVTLQDVKTGKLSYLNKTLTTNGLQAGLVARTDKDVYAKTEAVGVISTIANTALNIEGATLDLKISRYKKPTGGEFTPFLPRSGATGCGTGDGQFSYPGALAVGADGSLYVLDSGRVQKFDKNGNFVTKWASGGDSIAAAVNGSVYVMSSYYNRIQKFDSNGNFVTMWSPLYNYWPNGITVDAAGFVYVTSSSNGLIRKFDGNGNFVNQWQCTASSRGSGCDPYGIAVAADGSLFVTETDFLSDGGVVKLDVNGKFVKLWGKNGNPYGIAVAADASVYVTDTGTGLITRYDSNGNYMNAWTFNVYQQGIAAAPDGPVYASRQWQAPACNSSVEKMLPFSAGTEILFEAALPINQPAGAIQDYTTDAGVLNATGKLYLDANLKNSLGQTIANAEYPFYIAEGKTVLSFTTDKKNYKPGDTVTVAGQVTNLDSVDAAGLTLAINSRPVSAGAALTTIYSNTLTVPAGGSYPFTFTATAGQAAAMALIGTVSQNGLALAEISDEYVVAAPQVSISIMGPDTVDGNPFDLNVQITNTGTIDAQLQYSLSDGTGNAIDSQSLALPAGQTTLLPYTQRISQGTTYMVSLSGDVSRTASKAVFYLYGESAQITIGSGSPTLGSGIYPEGTLAVPVTITNTGTVDETVAVTYTLQPSALVQTNTYFLPKGGSVNDTLSFDVVKGTYQFTAASLQPVASGTASFIVAKDPEVIMTTTAGNQGTDGLIPVTVNVANSGCSGLNGSIAVAVMNNFGKAVWRGETQIANLAAQASQNYVINVASAGMPAGAYSASVTLYNSSGRQLATNQTQVRTSGPIFEIASVPANPAFTQGTQGAIAFAVKNTGTLAGTANLSVSAANMLNQTVSNSLQPGEQKAYTLNFTVPEDQAATSYAADYALTSTDSQGTTGQAPFTIAAVNFKVIPSLDKQVYNSGDTAVLNLAITKQSQFQDGAFLVLIRYGAYHDIQGFVSGEQPASLTFNVPLSQTTGNRLFYGVYFPSGTRINESSLHINTPPVVTAVSPAANSISYSAISISAAVFDGGLGISTVQYQLDNGTWTSLPLTDPSQGLYSTIWTPASADNGNHAVTFRATDSSGNMSLPVTVGFIVQMDSTPPTGSIAINGGAAYTNTPAVTLALGCADALSGCALMQFSGDNTAWSAPEAYTSTRTWPLTTGDGQKTVYVKFVDAVGNVSGAYSAGIMLDTVPPVTAATPGGGLYNWAKSVALTANESATIYYTTDGTVPSRTSAAYSGPITITSTATLNFFAVDPAGNSEAPVKSAAYTIDTQDPTLLLSMLPDGSYTNNATLNIAGTATDNIAVQGVTINDTAIAVNAAGAFSGVITLATGSNTITTVAADTAGNLTKDLRTITLDQTLPLITITSPADNSVTNAAGPTVTGAVDKTATVTVQVNSGSAVSADMTGNSFSLPVTLVYGQNTIEVTATDLASNASTAKRTVTFDNASPSLAITNPAQDMTTNQSSIQLQGTVADLTGTTVTITMEGISSTPTVTGGTFQQTLSFSAEKQYAVLATATDAAGNKTTVQRNIIYVRAPDSLTYTGATLLAQGRAATLSAVLKEGGTTPPDLSGKTVTFTLGSGSSSQSCIGTTDAGGNVNCTISPVNVPIGHATVTATFSGDSNYQPSTDRKSVIIYSSLPVGSFIIGDKNAVVNSAVTFWGAQWGKKNSLSSGPAPASFKGFADSIDAIAPPGCGGTWNANPGNSSSPPGSVPAYMAVLVSSSINKSGNTIAGNVAEVVVVQTNPGYGPDPGHAGTGTVVGVLRCN